ncbi:hypothetical protein LV457_05065 [Mycobacterium sp. MYCO198283]|uniref:hypothetical protein n=1 Tax=Mycobacterium sp. MYCO198283 TaxID=2883505 RepID=UPI001E4A95AE|nr:hypothetical protein [Mycobacterium sp. MYCO198283]MCG5431662.1 hypothetical protein [Mycobacterium sp. MYCO198283]
MTGALLLGYAVGWLLTSLILFTESRVARDRDHPAAHPVALAVLTGAAWPIVLLGFVEAGSLLIAAKALGRPNGHPVG